MTLSRTTGAADDKQRRPGPGSLGLAGVGLVLHALVLLAGQSGCATAEESTKGSCASLRKQIARLVERKDIESVLLRVETIRSNREDCYRAHENFYGAALETVCAPEFLGRYDAAVARRDWEDASHNAEMWWRARGQPAADCRIFIDLAIACLQWGAESEAREALGVAGTRGDQVAKTEVARILGELGAP
jgi:hypothetical protein